MTRISESQNLRMINEERSVFVSKFSDLKVYQKSVDVALDIHKTTQEFPKTEQYGGLGDQMRRASKGISANVAEGYAKQQGSKAEFKRFLLMAIGSAHEMQVWTEYCSKLDYIDTAKTEKWTNDYDEIVRMLQSLYSKI